MRTAKPPRFIAACRDWFVCLLTELGHELWIGDSAKIRASEVRKQKTDERDARLILSARNSAGWSCPIAWPILLPCRGRPACLQQSVRHAARRRAHRPPDVGQRRRC